MVIFFVLASFLDLVGLGLIAPYISLVINPEKLELDYLYPILSYYELELDWVSLVLFLGLGLVFIFFCKTLSNLWIQYKIISFGQEQQVRLRTYLMQAYQNLSYKDFLGRNSSEYLHSIQTLVPYYGNVVSTILRLISDSLVAGIIIIVLAWQNILILSVLLVLLGGLVLIYDKSFRQRLREYGIRNNEYHHQVVQNLHEAIDGFKEHRILGKENYFYAKLKEGVKWNAYFEVRQQLLNLSPGYSLEFILIVFVVTILSSVAWLGGSILEILPTMGVFGVAALRLKPTANSLASGLVTLRFYRDTVHRLFKDTNNLESSKTPKKSRKSVKNGIEPFQDLKLKQVSFSYNNTQKNILENVSLHIKAGEAIGLVGSSGGGKTTLVDVLLGLLEPDSGSLEFNGRNVDEIENEWTSHVAYIPQQIFISDNTLKSNVALGIENSEIDETRLLDALKKSRLIELVDQLPEGVNTFLGERGIRLSGGQRQRVALARALYHERSLLVMDEATSALDNETEREIVEEIRRLKGQKTMIVIAHRLTTVQHCDRIYRLEKGRIVEEGTPEQVLDMVN